MLQYENCPSCFAPLKGSTVCPKCGRDHTADKKYPGTLPPFTVLHDRFIVGRVLGKGGFGITYVAQDIYTNEIVAIKEYMPAEYSSRSNGTMNVVPHDNDKARYVFEHGREKFKLEAQTLMRLSHNPVVVDIKAYFYQNNTAYLVMEYLDGDDLRKMARSNGGVLEPGFTKQVFVTIASSLMEVHNLNILHRDISPENIIVTKDGQIKLIDFGAARNFVSTQNKGMSILLKVGYAPPEQYDSKGCQGPWSDIYALCATFYNLVSGKALMDAMFRYRGAEQPSLYALGCAVSKKTSSVIERGMDLDYRRRYQNFKALLDDLDLDDMPSGNGPVKKKLFSRTPVNPPDPTPTPVTHRPPTPPTPTPPTPPTPAQRNYYVAAVMGNSLLNRMMIPRQDIFKIGRSPQSCQYVVSGDTNISRIHCYLRVDNGRIFLSDTSSNGTYLENGRRLDKNKEYQIQPGTKFYIATKNHMFVVNG